MAPGAAAKENRAANVFLNLTYGAQGDAQPYLYDRSILWQYNAYTNGYCAGGPGERGCPAAPWRDYRRDGTAANAKVWESYSYHSGTNLAGGWENEDQGDGFYAGPVLPLGLAFEQTTAAAGGEGGEEKEGAPPPATPLAARVARWNTSRADASHPVVVAWRAQGWYVNAYDVQPGGSSAHRWRCGLTPRSIAPSRTPGSGRARSR